MSVINFLSSSKGQKGNEANIALAKEISETGNIDAVLELTGLLESKNKNTQSDSIKVLYEVGYRKPELIADYHEEFIKLLENKNNRLIWGAMAALATITELRHQEIYSAIDQVMNAVKKGSVITIDCGIEILAKLNAFNDYSDEIEPLLIDQLWRCPIKQLPMYIEKSMISVNVQNKDIFLDLIRKRINECEKDSQVNRLQKSLRQILKIS